LIFGSPLIGGAIGVLFNYTKAQSGGIILAVFILGEILFYGSLFFLGKEIVMIVRDGVRFWFQGKKKRKQ
jgi:hypothetical protein